MRYLLLFFVFFGLSCPAGAAESYRPLDHLWMGTRDIPDERNWLVLGTGVALTAGAFALDTPVHDYFAGHNRLGPATKIGNDYLGTGVPGVVVGLATLAYGLIGQRAHEVDAGEAHLEGLAATAVYTHVLKLTVRRSRPDSENRTSFPSGHTSITFSSAGSLFETYGYAAGIPALVLAGFTGASRLDANAHHLSDVIFGAVLGFVVGRSYAFHHNRSEEGGEQQLSVQPYYDGSRDFGLAARLQL